MMRLSLVFVLLCTVLCYVSSTPVSTSCDLPAAGTVVPISSFQDCFASFPLNKTAALQTVDVVTNTLKNFYTFRFQANSSTDIPSEFGLNPYDVLHQLSIVRASINAGSYTSMWGVHRDVANAILSLKDPHTAYHYPTCFQTEWLLPFNIAQFAQPGSPSPSILVSDVTHMKDRLTWDYYTKTLGIPLGDYALGTVMAINDVDPILYLEVWSSTYLGVSKIPSTLFNMAVLNLAGDNNGIGPAGAFATRGMPPFVAAGIPEGPWTFKIRMTNGTTSTLTVPMTAVTVNTNPITTPAEFAAFCADPSDAAPGVGVGAAGAGDLSFASIKAQREARLVRLGVEPVTNRHPHTDLLSMINDPTAQVPVGLKDIVAAGRASTLPGATASTSTTDVPVMIASTASGELAAYASNSSQLLVFALGSFGFNETQALDVISHAYAYAQAANLTKVIIDLTDNGGGELTLEDCLVYALAGGSGGELPCDQPMGSVPTTLAKASLSSSSSDMYSPFGYGAKLGVKDMQPYTAANGSEWFTPARSHSGGTFSQPYYLNLGGPPSVLCPFTPQTMWAPSDILLLSNGLCGSSCALFAFHLSKYFDGVKTAVATSLPPSNPVQAFSFPGGEVYNLQALRGDLDSASVDTAPYTFPTDLQSLSFAVLEAFANVSAVSAADATPLEYQFYPADCIVPLGSNQLNYPSVYSTALETCF